MFMTWKKRADDFATSWSLDSYSLKLSPNRWSEEFDYSGTDQSNQSRDHFYLVRFVNSSLELKSTMGTSPGFVRHSEFKFWFWFGPALSAINVYNFLELTATSSNLGIEISMKLLIWLIHKTNVHGHVKKINPMWK